MDKWWLVGQVRWTPKLRIGRKVDPDTGDRRRYVWFPIYTRWGRVGRRSWTPHMVRAFGTVAESAANHLQPYEWVAATGHLAYYETRKHGVRVYHQELVADSIEYMGHRAYKTQRVRVPEYAEAPGEDPWEEFEDEEFSYTDTSEEGEEDGVGDGDEEDA